MHTALLKSSTAKYLVSLCLKVSVQNPRNAGQCSTSQYQPYSSTDPIELTVYWSPYSDNSFLVWETGYGRRYLLNLLDLILRQRRPNVKVVWQQRNCCGIVLHNDCAFNKPIEWPLEPVTGA